PNGFTNTIHKMDMEEGGEWLLTMHGPDGKNYPNKSIFKEVVLHKRIVYQHFNPKFTTTVEFEPQEDKTFMKWQMLFDTRELYETVVKTFGADKGLRENVAKLEFLQTPRKFGIITTNLSTSQNGILPLPTGIARRQKMIYVLVVNFAPA